MDRVLVTGGAGFIGSWVVERLLAGGKTVRVIDNLSTGSTENLARLATPVELIRDDIRDADAVQRAVSGMDAVIHLAAEISVPSSMLDPTTTYEVNVMGTLNVLDKSRRAGVRSCVIASSAAVYGNPEVAPVNESTPTSPLSPYGSSKLECEILGKLYSVSFGLPAISLRLFNVYGPRQRHDSPYAAAVPIFLSRMMAGQPPTVFGDGKQCRDFVFVDDVALAFVTAFERPDLGGRVYNIGSGTTVNLLELIGEMNVALGTRVEPEFGPERVGDIRFSAAEVSLADRQLGFRAGVPLSAGLSRMAGGLQEAAKG